MKFKRYSSLDNFRDDVLPVLLEDEVCNNLPVSIVADKTKKNVSDWLMGTVVDGAGRISLVAFCTPPFNIMLYTTNGDASNDAARFLGTELDRCGQRLPGVLAKPGPAHVFTEAFTGKSNGTGSRSMVIMRLDVLLPYERSHGICRVLTEDDLDFVSVWEQAFCVDCGVPSSPLNEKADQIRLRLGRNIHYIWEDVLPVSQAVFGRETPNGAVITWVYTPPLYRSRGYATSVVGELSRSLLSRGKKFCCLFADAGNPISRGIYKKLGYYDVCGFEEISF